MPETRRIENYGILKLFPPERGAVELIITCDVIQLPYSEYVNLKTNPFKSHYGYVCLMHQEYVIDVIDIQFRRQVIAYRNRHLVQLAWQEFCNSKVIAQQLGAPLPDTSVDYSIWICDELRFRLEPGVIINVFKSHIPPVTCSGSGIVEPDLSANPPGLPPVPSSPPPPSTPEADKLPLSSPYEGDDDEGNTYVRDIPQEPTPSEGECWTYRVVGTYMYSNSSGAPGAPFDIQINAQANSWSGTSGNSSGELYLFYKACGSTTESIVSNGFGGITGAYDVTPIAKVS